MSVQKRTTKAGKPRWVARYRDPAGRQHSKTFAVQREAKAWLADQEQALNSGRWVDPPLGTVTVQALVDEWAGSATRVKT